MTVTVKDLAIHYEAFGEGIPLLALHGWGVDHRLMSGCLEPVFEKCPFPCRRYYPDLPGMGLTPGTDRINGSDDMLTYIEAFIDALFPDEPFLLAGESYGGYLSRGLLRRMPGRIRGLLLVAPSFRPWVKTETGFDKGDVPDHRVIEEDAGFLARMTEEERNTFRFMGVRLTESAWNLFKRDVLPGIKAADQQFLEDHLSRRVPFATDPDSGIETFNHPALIVTARQDASVGYRDIGSLLEKFPRATYAVLDGAGHNLQTERVPLFEQLVSDWLERIALFT